MHTQKKLSSDSCYLCDAVRDNLHGALNNPSLEYTLSRAIFRLSCSKIFLFTMIVYYNFRGECERTPNNKLKREKVKKKRNSSARHVYQQDYI